ncbi:MAG TPA: ABC transporter permease [Bacteroidales bacterium]|nr:ABC transporter permease [Bacteroidales bacterium]
MKNISIALWAEYMKFRKSKVFVTTLIVFTLIPLMIGLMMFVSRNPDIASKLGLIGTKAKMFGENDWKGYLDLMTQVIASIGLLGFGFVTAWVFGCEHNDRTMKDILALPVGRISIVIAKFIITFTWCLILAVIAFSVGIGIGLIIDMPGWSPAMFYDFSRSFFITSFFTLFLCSPVAYITGYTRGIIAPLGFVLLTMIFAQFISLVGLGPYFPWAIPGLYSVAKDEPGFQLHLASYFILALTFLLGYWGTIHWWQHADHNR